MRNSKILRSSAYVGGGVFVDHFAQVTAVNSMLVSNCASDSGATILAQGNAALTVQNCIIQGNSAYQGGAVSASGSSIVSIEESTLEFNHAYRGGAIHADGDATTIAVNSFVGFNFAIEGGGAIYAGSHCQVLMGGSSLVANNSSGSGGGIVAHSYSSVSAIGGFVSMNLADGFGAAVVTDDFACVLMCEMMIAFNGGRLGGGVVFTYDHSSVGIVGCTLLGNFALMGGVFNLQMLSMVNVQMSTMIENEAGWGAVAYVSDGSEIVMSDCTMSHNQATRGGVLFIDAIPSGSARSPRGVWTQLLQNCTLSENTASWGGAISLEHNSALELRDCTISSNTASVCGGAIRLHNNATLNALDCAITRNAVGWAGGAICVSGGSLVSLSKGSVSENLAIVGGAIGSFDTSTTVLMHDVSLLSNTAAMGGAIGASSGSVVSAQRCTFTRNRASQSGGVVAMSSTTNSDFAAHGSSFTNNTAGISGGVLVVTNRSRAAVTGSFFASNQANISAGGILVYPGGTLYVSGSVFQSNSAMQEDRIDDIVDVRGVGSVMCQLSASEDEQECSPIACAECFCSPCDFIVTNPTSSANDDTNNNIRGRADSVEVVTNHAWFLVFVCTATLAFLFGVILACRKRPARAEGNHETSNDNYQLVARLLQDADASNDGHCCSASEIVSTRSISTMDSDDDSSLSEQDLVTVPESSTLEHSTAPVFVIDAGMRIVLWSRGMTDVTMLDPVPPVMTALPFISHEARTQMCDPIAKMLNQQLASNGRSGSRRSRRRGGRTVGNTRFEMHLETSHGPLLLLMTATTMSTPGLICISGREADVSLLGLRGALDAAHDCTDDDRNSVVSTLTESEWAASPSMHPLRLRVERCSDPFLHFCVRWDAASTTLQRSWRDWRQRRNCMFSKHYAAAYETVASLKEGALARRAIAYRIVRFMADIPLYHRRVIDDAVE